MEKEISSGSHSRLNLSLTWEENSKKLIAFDNKKTSYKRRPWI